MTTKADQEDIDTIFVREEEEGLRIDKLLSARYEQKSRTYFQFLIDHGSVLINGKKVKKRTIPKKGEEIEIFFILTKESDLTPQNIPLDVIYEDDDIIAINKPSGMVVHPAPGNRTNTFVNALLYRCRHLASSPDDLRPGIVHRLDKDTSGVLLAAKNERSHRKLIEQFSSRTVEKRYLAVCWGCPTNQKVIAPIGRNRSNRKEMAVVEEGKEAVTEIETLAQKENLGLVLAKPKTGRTHQIRVHMKYINAPIVGDTTYGSDKINKKFKIDRQLLHAYSIEFSHPSDGKKMKITATLPPDFQEFIEMFESVKI